MVMAYYNIIFIHNFILKTRFTIEEHYSEYLVKLCP